MIYRSSSSSRGLPTKLSREPLSHRPPGTNPAGHPVLHRLRRGLDSSAVTRGKRPVVAVGQPKALAIAVTAAQAWRRWSKLGEWLGGGHEAARPVAAKTVG